MSQIRVIAAVAITGMVATMPLAAQGKSGSNHGGGTATHGRPATAGAQTTTHGKSGSDHSGGGSAKHGATGEHDATGETETHGKSGRDRGRPESSSTSVTGTTGSTALATKISQNPEQLAKVTAMLPAGVTLDQATAGFRNQGQFIAALNASKNQGVSFVDLQKAMTVDGLSLGQAVRKLKPPTTETTTTTGTGTTTPTTSSSSSTTAS